MDTFEQGGQDGADRTPISVLIVDDHHSFAEALALAIGMEVDLTHVGSASSVNEAVEMAGRLSPNVVLMDVHLPDADGVEGTRRVKDVRPDSQVVVLTADTDPALMARAASAGASGFMLKQSRIAEVLDAIRSANDGDMLIRGSTLSAILARLERPQDPTPKVGENLTAREIEVLSLLAEGKDVRAIARHLTISVHTARGHVKNILAKLEVHSQLEAVVAATRAGLVATPSP